jgi:hypothetical protein
MSQDALQTTNGIYSSRNQLLRLSYSHLMLSVSCLAVKESAHSISHSLLQNSKTQLQRSCAELRAHYRLGTTTGQGCSQPQHSTARPLSNRLTILTDSRILTEYVVERRVGLLLKMVGSALVCTRAATESRVREIWELVDFGKRHSCFTRS